jgi:hypothetical protein
VGRLRGPKRGRIGTKGVPFEVVISRSESGLSGRCDGGWIFPEIQNGNPAHEIALSGMMERTKKQEEEVEEKNPDSNPGIPIISVALITVAGPERMKRKKRLLKSFSAPLGFEGSRTRDGITYRGGGSKLSVSEGRIRIVGLRAGRDSPIRCDRVDRERELTANRQRTPLPALVAFRDPSELPQHHMDPHVDIDSGSPPYTGHGCVARIPTPTAPADRSVFDGPSATRWPSPLIHFTLMSTISVPSVRPHKRTNGRARTDIGRLCRACTWIVALWRKWMLEQWAWV